MQTRIVTRLLLLMFLVAVILVIQGGMPHAEMILNPASAPSPSSGNDKGDTVHQGLAGSLAPCLGADRSPAPDLLPTSAPNQAVLYRAPEPTSLAMLLGLAGVFMVGRRLRRIWAG